MPPALARGGLKKRRRIEGEKLFMYAQRRRFDVFGIGVLARCGRFANEEVAAHFQQEPPARLHTDLFDV